jgi:hypothetical protein
MDKPDTRIKQTIQHTARKLTIFILCFVIVETIFSVEGIAGELPEWTGKIRKGHPRLFFNSDTWPNVRQRALGPERHWYNYIKGRVDNLIKRVGDKDALDTMEYGQEAAWAAFVYRVTKEQKYLNLSKKCLDASLRVYDECFN